MSNPTQLSFWQPENKTLFEKIKHIDDGGKEYWLARELMVVLDYSSWQFFEPVIKRAKMACKKSQQVPADHFMRTHDDLPTKQGAVRKIANYKLSKYACYLVAMNGDPNKEPVAQAQTYFAAQTHKQEQAKAQKQIPPRQTKDYRRALDSGYSQDAAEDWVALDQQGKEARKKVTAEWAARGGNIPKLTNFVTKLATGKRATDWKIEMHIEVSPRQYFSPLKKGAIAIVELFSALRHRSQNSHGDAQLAADIADMADIINWEALQRLEDRDLKLPAPKPEQKRLGEGR